MCILILNIQSFVEDTPRRNPVLGGSPPKTRPRLTDSGRLDPSYTIKEIWSIPFTTL